MASENSQGRRFWLSRLVLALLVGSGVWVWGANASPNAGFNPAAGQVDGRTAMTVVPQEPGVKGDLPPWGYLAHLTGHDDPSVDITFPCGIWSQPPAGRYRVWVEGDWQISPFTHVVSFSPRAFRGSGMVTAASVVDAGRVALSPGFKQGRAHQSLRLLHAGSYLEEGYPRWELSRRKSIREAGDGLLMPVGPAIGALWDERSERYVALSRPFEVKRRKTVVVPLEVPPTGAAHLVAQIQRVSLARDANDAKMTIVLVRNGRFIPPNFQVSAADRSYAVWYGLASGPAELRAETGDAVLQPYTFNLAAGKIERIFQEMTSPPVWAQAPRQ